MYPIPSWMAPFRVDEVVCGESRWRQGPQGLSVQRPLRHVPHRGHPAASRARIRQGNSRLPSRALRATATQSRGRHGRKWIRGCRGSEGQLLIMGTSRVFFGDGSTALTAEHFKKATKEGTAYLSKALTAAATGGWGVGGGCGGRAAAPGDREGLPVGHPQQPPGYLLIRGLSRRVHTSMAQLLPVARARLPRHRGGLGNRERNQLGREGRQKVQAAQKRAGGQEEAGLAVG